MFFINLILVNEQALLHRSTFPSIVPIQFRKCAFTPKKSGTRTQFMRTFSPPFQPLLESRYFRGRKRFLCLIGWADCKPRSVKLPKSFVKPPLYLLALALLALALAQRTNEERLTYGNTKENMGAVEMRRCRRFWQFTRKASEASPQPRGLPAGDFGWQ